MAEEEKSSAGSGEKNTGMAALSYLGILVLVPLLTEAKKDPFVKFHAKQGLVLLICWVIGGFVIWIPFVGWLIGLGILVLAIIGIVGALGGSQKPLPVIGSYAEKIKI